ncbi:3-methyl-2-oxobutanoate hydroxymethyltransferase [Poriferisphaera sp. WC338]|uniref:3-methyl-2-oxobutanoate hydroxymethyltransferase n=1 Tax=Poriferisphaera sp. WC338 TaxID=3425129 RepID=UPI003D815C77
MTQSSPDEKRVSLRDIRHWARDGKKFPMITCYDATTARHIYEGGCRVFLVGDTAAQMILGHDSTLPVPVDFMIQLTAAVRRGAPGAIVMGDMPFGSYQCGDDIAMKNACSFLAEGGADLIKLEVDRSHAILVERMSHAGIPVVAHIGSRPQTVRAMGGFHSTGRTKRVADILIETAETMIAHGAVALLVEAVPDEVTERIVAVAKQPGSGRPVPVIGCGAGPAAHGHVVVFHDIFNLSSWQPPFAKPIYDMATPIRDAAAKWVELVESGRYLKDGGPYTMMEE